MTRQETFDFVVKALIKQGKPSMNSRWNLCMYRSPDGLKCAAGHCIPDEHYNPSLEDAVVESDSVAAVIEKTGHDLRLLVQLQRAHDSPARTGLSNDGWLTQFLGRARHVAKEFGLNPDACGWKPEEA